MNIDFVIGIPSYQRSGEQKTLQYLSDMRFPRENIYIFVQTEKDRAEYQKYAEAANIIYREADGIAQARNNVLDYLCDRKILMMDDDITGFKAFDEYKNLEPVNTLEKFVSLFNRCFKYAEDIRAPLFGIYPVDNDFFMSQSISTAVTVNTVIGFQSGAGWRFNEKMTAKEDIELCARIMKSGGRIARYNFISVTAKHRTNKGGCNDIWKTDANEVAAHRLELMYPGILKQRVDNPAEVRVTKKDRKIQRRAM